MTLTPIIALTILIAIYAFGDIIASKTKGILSTIFVICVVLLIAFWCGLPADIATTAGIASLGSVLIGPLVVSIGTTMNFAELKRQWKVVIISLVGMTVGVVLIIAIGQFVIGWNASIASAPIFAGATVALLLVQEQLEAMGLMDTLGVIVIVVFATQKFIGVPLTSFCLQKDAKAFLKDPAKVKLYAGDMQQTAVVVADKRPMAFLCKFDNKPSVNLAKLCLVAWVSVWFAGLFGNKISYVVFALLFGVIFTELGLLSRSSGPKTDSYFLMLFILIMSVFGSLSKVTPASLAANIGAVLFALVIGAIGVIVAGIICGKLFKMTPYMCIALGITCTFGFPTTALISKEIAENIGTNATEVTALTNYILPKMTVAGFATVTIGSAVLAGLIVPLMR